MSTNTTQSIATATSVPTQGSGFMSMATAQKAGIGLAVAIIVIFILLGLLWLINRRKRTLKLRQKHAQPELALLSQQNNEALLHASEKGPGYQEVPLHSPRLR